MIKCFISGIEVEIDSAHVLDRAEVFAHLRHLRHQTRLLETLLKNLGQQDVNETAAGKRRHRRLVTSAMAEALTEPFPKNDFFITWPRFIAKQLVRFLKTKGLDSVFKQYLVNLGEEDLTRIAATGRDVLKELENNQRLPHPVRLAVLAGICVECFDWETKKIARLVRSVIKGNTDNIEQLSGCGELGIQAIQQYYEEKNHCDPGEAKRC